MTWNWYRLAKKVWSLCINLGESTKSCACLILNCRTFRVSRVNFTKWMKLASLCRFQFTFFNCDTCGLRLHFSKGYNALYDFLLLIWNWFKILDSSVHTKKCGCVHIDGDMNLAIISKLLHRFQLTLRISINFHSILSPNHVIVGSDNLVAFKQTL